MKTVEHTLIILTSVSGLLFVGCKQEPNDFRDKYLGNWNFTVEIVEFNTDSISYYYHDTVYYSGFISYGIADNEIEIKYLPSKTLLLTVDDNGLLTNFPAHYCSGGFEGNNKGHRFLRWGGLGGGIYHIVDGYKTN